MITKKKMGKEAMRFLLNQRSGSCQLFCKKRPFSWWVKWNPLQCRHFPFSFSFFTFHSRFSNSSCILVRRNPLQYRQSWFLLSLSIFHFCFSSYLMLLHSSSSLQCIGGTFAFHIILCKYFFICVFRTLGNISGFHLWMVAKPEILDQMFEHIFE